MAQSVNLNWKEKLKTWGLLPISMNVLFVVVISSCLTYFVISSILPGIPYREESILLTHVATYVCTINSQMGSLQHI